MSIRAPLFLQLLMLLPACLPLPGAGDGSAIVISFKERGACVMVGKYHRGAFVSEMDSNPMDADRFFDAVKRTLAGLRTGETISGIDKSGKARSAVIGRTRIIESLGESSVDLMEDGATPLGLTILSRPRLRLSLLIPQRGGLLKGELESQLREKLQELWTLHITERIPEERRIRYEIRGSIVESVKEDSTVLAIRYLLDLVQEDGGRDERAEAFFLYSRSENRILRATFGHPEWAPGSSVLTIRPEIYFRVSGDRRIYFLGLHESGWEDANGWAVYDLRTGRSLVLCY